MPAWSTEVVAPLELFNVSEDELRNIKAFTNCAANEEWGLELVQDREFLVMYNGNFLSGICYTCLDLSVFTLFPACRYLFPSPDSLLWSDISPFFYSFASCLDVSSDVE